MWVEELNEQGNPTFVAEGGAKSQVSVRYEEREMKSKKVAAWVKVTEEMLRDLPQLITYIQTNLVKRIDLITESALFTADGTGNNLTGLTEYAVPFTGGGLTSTSPTFADVFRALALQVELANGTATAVFVKPSILAQMDVEKDSEGRYIIPPFRSPSTGNQVAGITLISTNALGNSDPDFIGGDLSVVNVRFREGMRIEMDRTGNDFTNNLYTILAEQELVQFVSANDVNVLVQGEMAEAIDEITAPTE
jgi:HK97 family phage major capsid protein